MTGNIPEIHADEAQARLGFRGEGVKSMGYEEKLPGSWPTMADLVAGCIVVGVLFGGLVLASLV